VSGSGDVDRENGVNVAALPLLLLLNLLDDYNITLPDGANATLFDVVVSALSNAKLIDAAVGAEISKGKASPLELRVFGKLKG